MNNQTHQENLEMHDFERPKLTGTLNVLTILTFIGCAIQLLSTLWSYINAQKSYDEKDKVIEQMKSGEIPGWAKSMMGDPDQFNQLITRSYENRLPILILGLVSVFLCFYGALQMRKLKKQGYIFYVIGELLPFVTMIAFIGAFSLTGFGFYISAGIALLFILLYTTQRKNLVY
jgi:hypothetical protein